MSHGHERKERNCLNCGAFVQGRYCQACGQENIEPKESFWSMLRHFFEDITHFDGKFFTTLKDLFVRPGFLSKEYMKGRRMSYLHPVRMYVFTSAIFFLIFFSFTNTGDLNVNFTGDETLSMSERDSISQRIQKKILKDVNNPNLLAQLKLLQDTSKRVIWSDLFEYSEGFSVISPIGKKYKTLAQYDSAQAALPVEVRDGTLKRLWNKRAYSLNEKYKGDNKQAIKGMIDAFLHRLPYMLFVSLPFFALILKLLYVRRKDFYYADHGIFSIHHYVLSFIILLLIMGLGKLQEISDSDVWDYLIFALFIAWIVYLYLAMKRFYGQGRVKTFFKFMLLNIIGFILLLILIVLFFLFSVFKQ